MKVENLFHIIVICFLGLGACKGKQRDVYMLPQLRFSLSADSSSVELHGLPADFIDALSADSLGEKEWQGLLGVYSDPNDPEMRDFQRPLAGQYSLRDSVVLFVPAEAFKRDSVYFARFYNQHILAKPSDMIMGDRRISGDAEVLEFVFTK